MMALRLYMDSSCTQPVSTDLTTPDTTHQAVASGSTLTEQRSLWIKTDDATKTYENVVLTASGDDANADYQYAPDNAGSPGTWANSLSLSDGAYSSAVRVWRRVQCANVTAAFTRTDIKHSLTWDEYAV